MRYLLMSQADENTLAPDERLFAEMGAFIEEMSAKGILLATGGLEPGGIRVTSAGGETSGHRRAVHRGQGGRRRLRPGRR